MSELLNFPSAALAVPAADIRMLADLLVSMQQACAQASAMLIAQLDHYDGDPDLENATDLEDEHAISNRALFNAERGPGCAISDATEEDDHSGGDVCDERHDPLDEDRY
ncbi:MAG: hypothetical protein O9296_04530 [Novosphingobium sp.]|jgi:hypothetical protein|nr:hypothetical protein [Novosphingobium sp.]